MFSLFQSLVEIIASKMLLHIVVGFWFLLGSVLMGKSPYNVEYDLKPVPIARKMVWRNLIDLQDPANWQPDFRLPCAKDRVALPEDYIIFLNYQLDAIELVMFDSGIFT